ncbi:hypothetical protein K1719_043802 [Acacia pycnantha]|nr:hypothetical protein K1719_043802 [Acacia pycnantha]
MVKKDYKRLKGCQSFRQRFVLATLSGTSIIIEDIRVDETLPGLLKHEVSFLRLLEKICDGCFEAGTKLKYKPGIVMGLEIRLKGITNDSKDPSVDTFRSTTLHILKRFGVPSERLDLKIVSWSSSTWCWGSCFVCAYCSESNCSFLD